jgi:hypothetical protein
VGARVKEWDPMIAAPPLYTTSLSGGLLRGLTRLTAGSLRRRQQQRVLSTKDCGQASCSIANEEAV